MLPCESDVHRFTRFFFLRISEAVNYGAVLLSWAVLFVPSITGAVVSSHNLFKIISRQPEILSAIESRHTEADYAGIEFNNVDFAYPTRKHVQVLNKLNLTVPEGKTIALVGSSGSGKSTCIQLLQRFYDVQNGSIYVGKDQISKDISLKDLRSKLCIVSQEPVLFDRTIAENIAYGFDGIEITINDIIKAAKMANVHEFIISLPMVSECSIPFP